MPRHRRILLDGHAYHVLNRGNRRKTVFKKEADYRAFIALVGLACQRHRLQLLSLCLMPNHFHFVVWLQEGRALPAYMHWLMNVHVHRYHAHYNLTGTGHLWQGRYRAFPIQDEPHLFRVMRYVEANPLRAALVERAQDWPWSSLARRQKPEWQEILDEGSVRFPAEWADVVNRGFSSKELKELRRCTRLERPYGNRAWVKEVMKSAKTNGK